MGSDLPVPDHSLSLYFTSCDCHPWTGPELFTRKISSCYLATSAYLVWSVHISTYSFR